MITSSQLRAARALLRWSANGLAHEAGIGSSTIQRYEVSPSIPRGNTKTLIDIQKTLEAAGVELIGTPADNNPGVRLLTNKVNVDNNDLINFGLSFMPSKQSRKIVRQAGCCRQQPLSQAQHSSSRIAG